MNGGTLIGYFRLDGVDMCNENWLRQDEEGLYITISFYPDVQPEDARLKWVIRPGEVSRWADENPRWFGFVCNSGLQMNLGEELMDVEEGNEDFQKVQDDFLDEFTAVATARGLWFSGLGVMSVKVSSPDPEPEPNQQDTRPLWRRILGLA